MIKEPKKTNAFLLTDHQDLQYIFAKIRKLKEINDKILAFIDPSLQRYCQVANVSSNRLVMLAANSSVASQLRFLTPDLLKKIRQDPLLQHIHEIQAKVGMPRENIRGSASKQDHSVKPLSSETAEMVLESAKSLDDNKLREVMVRIAGRTKKSGEG